MSVNTSFFGELLTSITEQGRALIEGRRARSSEEPLSALCEKLLSGHGEASGVAIAEEVLATYRRLQAPERLAFFRTLYETFGADTARVAGLARRLADNPEDPVLLRELHSASEPRRQELIRRLNLAPGGTSGLVAMRADLLQCLGEAPELIEVDRDFEHLFSSWFNRGFLVMRRIDWATPANILEKIIQYEAVHEIKGWGDLRRRIGLEDRRLYAFFHPALVDDLLIFVEVALTQEIPGAIGPILAEERAQITAREANTAVFYSISNCQTGLRGISFGNFLIKQVVEELRRELPNLKTFVTLSPVPGFARWLTRDLADGEGVAARLLDPADRTALETGSWLGDEAQGEALAAPMSTLCAHYLTQEKARGNRPLDPVARFHIGNGARLERIHWNADLSDNGLRQSHGLMVNYLYDLKDIERNHESFAATGAVAASSQVGKLLRQLPDPKQTRS
ncbi:malonyl-CoA decarboxylase [Roseibium aestuarii]|uniref:Malonyl-CoA decarboxylase n=1 Tax=Roseibium aestuarii TaxID=2600299 RepID=A0ABW4JU55_9HYPH|nr:malonyl-CoA decarboxylase [Roseibium aestuarii]